MDTLNENIKNEVMDFFRALANVDRLKIAGALGLEALSLEQVAAKFGLRSAEAYNHLSNLVHFGLVKTDGKLYALDKEALEDLSQRVLANSRQKPKLEDFEGEAFDKKVLSDFLTPEGRLKALPAQNKKLLVILRHAQARFAVGEKYTEKQVNEILGGFFADTASLRRYLVDNKLLERDKGIYWRV